MKKTVLFLAGFLLFVSAAVPVFAAPTATAASVTVAPTPTPVEEEAYVLPFPGVLPDNPLYFLKTIRDRVMEWLIADPLRKIDFYVLQSDKTLNAGIMLNLANKKSLVFGVLTESVTDIGKAVSLASSVQSSGRQVPAGTLEHISNSLTKHEEVLSDLANTGLIAKVKSLEDVVSKLK